MKQLKTDRSIVTYIIFGLLTCGIYNLWYLHHLVKDVNEICREDGKQSPGVLMYILLTLLTCGLYSLFWWYRLADMLQHAVKKRGLYSEIKSSYVLICFVLGMFMLGIASYVGIHQVFEATNELATDYNAKQTVRPVPKA